MKCATNKMKYPEITIPGKILIKKNNPVLSCFKATPNNKTITKACGGRYRPGVASAGGITEREKEEVVLYMRRSWGLPAIETPVNIKLSFHVTKFPPLAGKDRDNAEQIYLDLLQADKWKVHRTGKDKGQRYLASSGAGVIIDDNQVHGTDGTRFVFECSICEHGDFRKKKRKKECPGQKKCRKVKTVIKIDDMIFGIDGMYHVKHNQ
jgi:hypothetical protein